MKVITMNALFSPAIALLNRLIFSRKFMLVGVFSVIATIVPLSVLYSYLSASITTNQHELSGAGFIQPINKLAQVMQQHRGLSSAVLSGSQEMSSKRSAKQTEVTEALAATDRSLPSELKELPVWKTIQTGWQSISEGGLAMTAQENIAAHTRLIDQVLTFMITVADQTELTLDPELDTYYLMEVAVVRQPIVLERLGRLRALGTPVLAKKGMDEMRKIAISIQMSELSNAQRLLSADIDKVAKARPDLKSRLDDRSAQFLAQKEQMLKIVNDEILTGNLSTTPEAYFSLATQTIDSGYQLFYDDLIPSLIKAVEERDGKLRTKMYLILGIALSAILLSLYLMIAASLAVVDGVRRVRESAEKLAEGDLTVHMTLNAKDEMADVANSFNRVIDAFRNLIVHAQSSAKELGAAAQQLGTSSLRLKASALTQSDATTSIAAAIEELTVGVDHITSSSEQAYRLSDESGKLSAHGEKLVSSVVDEIKRISTAVHASSKDIESLGGESAQISQVVQVIKDIADQTNLLALNAAIEAARAGEQGRGFAVVADEVRKLAERTANSTSEITRMVSSIQQGTKHAVTGIEVGVEGVENGVNLARQAGEAMHGIESGAASVLNMVSEISSALKEQSVAATDIAKNVEQIAQMAEANSAAVADNASTANRLTSLAAGLETEIRRFRV